VVWIAVAIELDYDYIWSALNPSFIDGR